MPDVLLGVVFVAVGGLLCFRGYLTMRVVIPVWGAFAGFLLGAGLLDRWTEAGLLVDALGWLVGLAVAVVFGLVAYTYYEVSVVLAMSAVGFVLGASAMVALDLRWSWAVVLGGVLGGVALAVLAVVGRLPMLLLTVLTALAGAATVVAGFMLLADVVTAQDLGSQAVVSRIEDGAGWWVLYAVLAVAGTGVQLRGGQVRRSGREQWAADGGRELYRGDGAPRSTTGA